MPGLSASLGDREENGKAGDGGAVYTVILRGPRVAATPEALTLFRNVDQGRAGAGPFPAQWREAWDLSLGSSSAVSTVLLRALPEGKVSQSPHRAANKPGAPALPCTCNGSRGTAWPGAKATTEGAAPWGVKQAGPWVPGHSTGGSRVGGEGLAS